MRRLHEERGAGLVEILVVMVLMGIVTSAIVSVVAASLRAEHVASEVRGELESVRVAFDRLRKEVRGTNEVRAGSDAKTIHLFLDRNADASPGADELISYSLTATAGGPAELRRWTAAQGAGNAVVVARGLRDQAVFTYLPAVGPTVVEITLAAESDSTRVQKVITHSTTVRLRNE